jgi:hypothetical protein
MDDGGPSRLRPFPPAEPVPATGDEPPAGASGGVSPLRPYLLTGGRTRPTADPPLELEAQLVTTETGQLAVARLAYERCDILRPCRSPLAVAEVAAKAGPMDFDGSAQPRRRPARPPPRRGPGARRRSADAGPPRGPASEPHRDRPLLERVIRGLQAFE